MPTIYAEIHDKKGHVGKIKFYKKLRCTINGQTLRGV